MPQPPLKTSGYDLLTDTKGLGLTQESIDARRLEIDQAEARKAREDRLKKYLNEYDDDPITQTMARAQFRIKEQEDYAAEQKRIEKAIADKHDDPLMKTWAIGQHRMEQTQSLQQKQAFEDRERLEQLRTQDKESRTLDRMGMGFAPLRETVGAAVNTVPDLASVVARLSGDKTAADTLNRQSNQFQGVREQSREDDMSPWASRMYGGASQSMIQMAATPGGAGAKIAGAGVMSGNQALTTAEDAGLTGGARLRYAGSQALFEAGVAALGQKIFGPGIESRAAGQAIAAQTWRQLARNIGTDALKEMPEEVVTSILQNISSKYEGVTPDMSLGDFIADATEAAVQAAMMAPMASTVGGDVGRVTLNELRNLGKSSKQTTPVFEADEETPTAAPEEIQGHSIDEMIAARDAAEQEQPAQLAKRPAIKAFLNSPKPSRKLYETAVKAGLPDIGKTTQELRKKYAEDFAAQAAPPATEEPTGKLPPTKPAEVLDTDSELPDVIELMKGAQNEAEATQGNEIDQGTKTPQGVLTDGPTQEADTPKWKSKEDFAKHYQQVFDTWMQYPLDQAGNQHYAEILSGMHDAHPDWADEVEQTIRTQTPPVATGGPAPVQSSPLVTEPGSLFPDPLTPETATPEPSTLPNRDLEEPNNDKPKPPTNTWTPKPEGVVRVVHISYKGLAKGIRDKGLNYAKQGMLQSTARLVDNEADLTTDDPKYQAGIASVFDIPVSEYRQHDDVVKSPGVVPAKYLVSQIPIKGGKPVTAATAKTETTPAPQKPIDKSVGRSLRSIVLSQGGINTKSLKKDYNFPELRSDGLLGISRLSGRPLDEMAQILESSGDLRTPPGRTPADWLIEQLKANADGARAEYSDAEIEARLEAERNEHERLKEYEQYGVNADGIEKLRKRSEEEGIRAANEGEPDEGFDANNSNEAIDTSFNFGANVKSDAGEEDTFTLKRPEKPKPKPEDFGTNPNTKQGGLFDAGKKGDKKGQELLFNSDPGDLNNPKTMENKAKADDADAKWWNNTLTTAGRSDIIKTAGLKLNPKALWRHLDEDDRAKLRHMRPPEEVKFEYGDTIERIDNPSIIGRFEGTNSSGGLIVKYDGTRTTWNAGSAKASSVKLDDQGRRVKEPAAAPEPTQEDLMEQILREELEEKPAKPKKESKPKPRGNSLAEHMEAAGHDFVETPAKPKSPKTKRTAKAKAKSEQTAADLKAAEEAVFKAFNSTPNTGLNPEQMRATAQLVKAALNHNVSKFNELVAYVVDRFGEPLALRMASGLELAWRALKRLEQYSGIDDAGSVTDVIEQMKGKANVETTSTPDASMGGISGESGGTLAPEAGSTSEVGATENGTGPDSSSVSGGTDSVTQTESEGTGDGAEGTGSKPSAGAKPKPGRNPAVKGSRKPTVRVPKPLGSPGNLRIAPDETIAPSGVVGKLKANLTAIQLLKQLQNENRQATEAEQRILMQYTGWGSLQHVFDETRGNAYIKSPGLTQMYGDQYQKALIYQKKGEYSSLEELQKRVDSWEKQWGDAYKTLKDTLTPSEWKRAAASVLNAHFTSREVITNGIWGALEHLGVTGGRFMEPSSGIGSLIGLMPESIANNSDVIAIELDSLTGDMVKQLYPEADVHVKGLEEVPIPPGTIDIAATNVPFHKIGPADAKKRYGRDMNLHNYFIARILDSLRPGGIAAVISTHFTMDSNPEDRALLAGKADLVGAIRLPNSAFKANAGTEVTTDIMFFRKPDGSPFKGESWQSLASVGTHEVEVKTKKGKVTGTKEVPFSVNEYFANHPEMVLGTHSMDGSQYSDTEYTVLPNKDVPLSEQLKQAVAKLPAGIATTDNAPLMPSMDTGTAGVDGRIEFRNGKLQELSNGTWTAPAWLKDAVTLTKAGKPRKLTDKTRAKLMANAVTQGIAYAAVRNAYEAHVATMRNVDATDAQYKASQKSLNTAYDAYREKHGAINHNDSRWLSRDPGFFFTSGIENEVEVIENGEPFKTYVKADVFRERTINVDAAPTRANSTEDAVKMSLAWRGAINLPWMSELTGTSEQDLEAELLESGTVFLNPETSLLEPADTYLSGNVHAKLRSAELAVADGDKRFESNVKSLKAAQPAKMTIDAITPSLGQAWIPKAVVNRWLQEVIKLERATVRYNEKADIWSVNLKSVPRDVQNEWGTLGMHLDELLPKVLNGSTIRVMKADPNDSKKRIVDDAQTQAAQIKAEKLRDSFEAWSKSDEKAIPLVEQAFNEQKNFYVKPRYNGEHLTFPGMSELWAKRMRPYQKNTIWRAIREGRGMIAHGVGAGKTAELIAIAMEMKRLGTATKPLIVVQNSTLGQFARTFNEVYPAAKVLVAGTDDLTPENRAKFMARISTGNWDAIVMAKSTFNMKVPNDPALEQAMVEGLIDELKAIMLDAELADGKGAPSVKAIQQQINSLVKRLTAIIDRVNARTDSDVFFEQMGVDALFLDEAHDYKKPPFVTKLDKSIKGLSTEVSGRALSALIKMRFVQDTNRGRNTFMATGTPITNTLGESWLLMNMVAPDVLQQFGVTTFDQFVATFARVSTNLETNAVGKLVRNTRLSKFKNGHQLAQFIQSGWDVLLGDDLHEKIREYDGGKVPKIEGGKEQLHLVERSPAFEAFGQFFLDVYDTYKSLTGEDKRTYSWIPMGIYGAAQAAAIDVRLVDPSAPDDPKSKLNTMIDGVYEAFKEGTEGRWTQLIFSDLSGRRDISLLRQFAAGKGVTLEGVEDEADSDSDSDTAASSTAKEDRWLYNEIKRKLIEKGVPEDQVQLITDHNSTPQKLLDFQDRVGRGEVRIVIGHSDTLGTGVNVQPRLKDIWELDIPMVPAKRQQRIGRAIRSGNMHEFVRLHVMAMQKSLDSTLMAMNLRKAKAAEQALSGKAGAEFDDPYSESLMSMADMEAAMNDDPLFYRQRELEFQVRQRMLEMEALTQQRSRERERLRWNEHVIESNEKNIASRGALVEKLDAILKQTNAISVDGASVNSEAQAEKVLKDKYNSESERISKATQASKIASLTNFAAPESDHVATEAEFGPVQFNLVYGERPEVLQDDKGNQFTKWTSTSGTIITMDGKVISHTRATTFSGIMKALRAISADLRERNQIAAKEIADSKAENVKLNEFLSKPFDAQIELDNLQSELVQVTELLFQRDNPAPATTTPDSSTETADPTAEPETPPANTATQDAIRAQEAKNAEYLKIMQKEWQKVTQGLRPATFVPVTDEMLRAASKYMLGTIRVNVLKFSDFMTRLRRDMDEAAILAMKPNLIRTWNALKNKYSLDDATEAAFEIAMSPDDDPDVETATAAMLDSNDETPATPQDPAPTPAASQDPVATAEDEGTYSTKNAYSARVREELGMGERQPVPTQGREASVKLAAEIGKTEAGRFMIDKLIAELQYRPRAVTPQENDLLLYRQVELKQKLREALQGQVEAARNGNDVQEAIQTQMASDFRQQRAQLIELVHEPTGTAAARALQARKAIVNDDFTLEHMALEYEAAFKEAPSTAQLAEMEAKIKALEADVAALEKLVAEEEAKNNDLETRLKEAHDNKVKASESDPVSPEPATEDAQPKAPATPATRTRREKALDRINRGAERIKDLLEQNTAFSVSGVLDEVATAAVEMATGYSELGVITFGEFIKRVGRKIGKEAVERIRPQLVTAWKQVRSASAGQQDISSITNKIDPMDPDTIGRAARALHSFVIERDGLDASAEGREAAVNAVFEILADFVPGITDKEVARAMSGIGIYSELSKDAIEAIRRDQKAQLLSLEQIADWKKKTPPPATGLERPPISDEQRMLRKLVNEAKKESGISTTTDGMLRSALDAAKRIATNRIADLTKAIESGQRIARSQKLLQPDAELESLQAERDALQKLYDQAFERPQLSDEQRINMAEKALDRAISKLESDLKEGNLYPADPRPRPTSAEIEAKRAELDALKASRDELRLSSGEAQQRSDAAYERHLKARDAELARRLAAKEYAPKPKKPERVLTPAMEDLAFSIAQKQLEMKKQYKEWQFKNRHIVYRTWMKGPVAAAHMIRKGLTTFDQSLIGRQGGLLGVINPKIYARAISKAFSNPLKTGTMFTTEKELFALQAALDADTHWVRLEKIGKLSVTDVHGGLNREEDARFVPEWFDKIPGIGGSERSGSAFINTQRRLVYRSLVDKLATKLDGKRSITNAELRVIGNFVNVSTGRGTIGSHTAALDTITTVFFSPRWWASRINWMSGQPIWHDARWAKGEGASKEVRQMIAVEWGKQAAAQAVIMGLAVAGMTAAFGPPGDDEEWDWYYDPRSPNFGKLRISRSYIDLTFGVGQHVSMLFRLLIGQQIDRWGGNKEIRRDAVFSRYMRGKLAPVAAVVGDHFVGKDMENNEFGSPEWWVGHVTPLMIQDVDESRTEGPVLATALSLMMFFGLGSQTYEERTREREDVTNELRTLKNQNAPPEKIQQVLREHLKHAATVEAKNKFRTATTEEKAHLQKVIDKVESSELDDAIRKEQYDLILNASARVSTDKRRVTNNEAKVFSGNDDKSRLTSRSLIPFMIPNVDDAIDLYNEAYRAENGSIREKNGNIKPAVYAGRARIRALYK